MSEHYSERARELFERLLGESPQARDGILAEECVDQPELRREVASLLRHAETIGSFLEEPLARPPGDPHADQWIGREVRGYRISEKIGEGGMASVFRAVRADEVFSREVAIKFVKHRSAVELEDLFVRERQILGRLEHPGIARLLDAGSTDDGVPFAILELVDGVPITHYCQTHRIDLERRLDLFCQVCEVVEAAHRHLVVHRDLKPSNILVSNEGEVKLLDFGIARPLADTLSDEETTRTLTPNYSSPEQLRGGPVSTSMDVYALGVVLHQMLCGQLPHNLAGLNLKSAVAQLESETTQPPSSIVRAEAAASMGLTPKALRRRLAGDLDTIVLAALEADPARRYRSAAHLADEIRRVRSGFPIRARSADRLYRIRRFARRNAVSLATGGAVLVALATLTAYSVEQARSARIERDRAEKVTEYLIDAFELADPRENLGETITVREVLDRSSERLTVDTVDGSQLRAALSRTFGQVYSGLGLFSEALPFTDAAIGHERGQSRVDERLLGRDLLTLSAIHHGIGDLDAAAAAAEEAISRLEESEVEAVPEALVRLSRIQQLQGEVALADETNQRAIGLYSAAGREHEPGFREALDARVEILWHLEKFEEAEEIVRDLLDRRREVADREPIELAQALGNLAVLLVNRQQYGEAEPLHLEAREIQERVLGPEHPAVTTTLNNLAFLYREQARFEEAEALFLDVLRRLANERGPTHPYVVFTQTNYANVLLESGQYARSFDSFNEALAIAREVWPDGHSQTSMILNGMGLAKHYLRDDAAAVPIFVEASQVAEVALGEESLLAAQMRGHLAIAKHGAGQWEEAEALFRASLETKIQHAGEDSLMVASALSNLAEFLTDAGRLEEAREAVERAAPIYRNVLPEGHWRIAVADSVRAAVLYESEPSPAAFELLEESLRRLEQAKGSQNFYTQRARERRDRHASSTTR